MEVSNIYLDGRKRRQNGGGGREEGLQAAETRQKSHAARSLEETEKLIFVFLIYLPSLLFFFLPMGR